MAIGGNYLLCWERTGGIGDGLSPPPPGGNLTVVAKPHLLRWENYDYGSLGAAINGVIYEYRSQGEREASNEDGSITEVQLVTPDYYVGEVILAFKRGDLRSETGVKDGDPTAPLDLIPPGVDPRDFFKRSAIWEDANNAGRCWAVHDESWPTKQDGEDAAWGSVSVPPGGVR